MKDLGYLRKIGRASKGVAVKKAIRKLIMLAATVSGSAWGHHSTAVHFDATEPVTLTGTLTNLDWRNPHIEFALDVAGDAGGTERWLIESQPPNFFARRKIAKADFEKGIDQTVTLEAWPARDGSFYATLAKITFPDGKVVVVREGGL